VTAGPSAPGITVISFSEGGLFSLAGSGSAVTEALAGANLRATVLEINGSPVAPINLVPSTASVTYNLVANPGLNQPWSVFVSINVASQLAGLGYAPNQRATKAAVIIDNALVAVSESMSAASISKGDFDVHISPEPSSAALLCSSLCALAAFRGRRGSR
jgi:hypothetical protein